MRLRRCNCGNPATCTVHIGPAPVFDDDYPASSLTAVICERCNSWLVEVVGAVLRGDDVTVTRRELEVI